jgi:four helix bundle protein
MKINSPEELVVYKKAYALAMEVFGLSKRFPAEERFALTSQIRRFSRSICLNLREAWAKRRYELHFISKLTDCDGENGETETSLNFAKDCGYISIEKHRQLGSHCTEIGRMLQGMMKKAASFTVRAAS